MFELGAQTFRTRKFCEGLLARFYFEGFVVVYLFVYVLLDLLVFFRVFIIQHIETFVWWMNELIWVFCLVVIYLVNILSVLNLFYSELQEFIILYCIWEFSMILKCVFLVTNNDI